MWDFSEVKRLMDEGVEKEQVPCSDILITYHGEEVFRYFNGYTDEKKEKPMQGKELYFLYSATKPVTCTAALQLYEKGKLGLDDRLSKYLPEWKQPITIRQLFSMTSGLNYDVTAPAITEQIQKNPASSTRELVKAMAGMELQFEPGSHFQYGLSHDVLAAVIEEISGMRFGEYLQKNIFDVCEMQDTGLVLTKDILERMPCQYRWNWKKQHSELLDKTNSFVLTPEYESGGAGLISSVEDYARFEKALICEGKLLRQETIRLMRENQLHGQAYDDFQKIKKGYGYGLGVRTDFLHEHASRYEFGWDGAAGAYVMLDLDRQVTLFYATHILENGEYLYYNLHPAIRDAVYEALEKN